MRLMGLRPNKTICSKLCLKILQPICRNFWRQFCDGNSVKISKIACGSVAIVAAAALAAAIAVATTRVAAAAAAIAAAATATAAAVAAAFASAAGAAGAAAGATVALSFVCVFMVLSVYAV